jgi:hypothetical protein
MKLIKMLGLATVAATVAVAFVGASSASAGPTALCAIHVNPCPAGFEQVGHFEALAVDVLLLTLAGPILCTHSVLLGNALGLGNPLLIHVTYLDFLNCNLGGAFCEVNTLETGLALLLRTALNEGLLQLHNTRFLVNCFAPFIHCIYGGLPLALVLGHNAALNELATIHTNGQLWEPLGGMACPNGDLKLDALYRINLPHPVYIVS